MTQRINIVLSEETLKLIDRIAPKGNRSRFISQAVIHYVEQKGKQNLRDRLKQEAIENADRDLNLAAEWFQLEEEAHKLTAMPVSESKRRKSKRA